ncbi:MAG: tRNA (adenosine(37)-N6)-dimethylallyltransferase MiaA [Desulfuromonas sp.]|nr:MAG: tRNA (adenosine(37)-N6)-dimethylallyltransferase MiaA [Desulfuromonas sp.]
MPHPFNLLVILGATASGKTTLGVQIATQLDGEIISADSRQVFRGMDLGTGKDLEEYGEIPYHLIDILAAGAEFSVFDFQKRCYNAIETIRQHGQLPLLVGGTGLYLDAVLRGYRMVEVPENPLLRAELAHLNDAALAARLTTLRPQQHNRTDLEDRQRLIRAIEIALGEAEAAATLPPPPPISPTIFGLRWPRPLLHQRISHRLKQRLKAGMIAEVEALHASGVSWKQLDNYGLEYRFISRHLQGELNLNDMTQQLASAIRQFAKRQETWFRRMEKQGTTIHWLDGEKDPFAQLQHHLERLAS